MKRIILMGLVMIFLCTMVAAQPTLPTISDITVTEGEPLQQTGELEANADNGTTTFYINGSETLSFGNHNVEVVKNDENTFTLDWDFGLVSADETYTFNVSVNDTNSTDYKTFDVTITNLPEGPTLNPISDKSVNEEDQLSFTMTTNTQADNGSISWSLEDSSIGALSNTNATHATFTWTAPTVGEDTIYNQNVTVSDGDSSDTQSFQITVVDVSQGIAVSDIKFGGSSQQRSNPELDDDDSDYDIYDDATFTITNNDGSSINNVVVSWPSASKYDISYVSRVVDTGSLPTVTEQDSSIQLNEIQPGQTVTVNLRARIPEDLDSFFENNPEDTENTIGELVVSAPTILTTNSDVIMEAENRLEIEELEICIDGDCDDYDNRDDVEEVTPGSEVEITLNAENRYSSSADLNFEDVEFNIFVDEDELDEDEDVDIGDIDQGDEESGSYTFTIDRDTDEDTYTIEIKLYGDVEDNGATHGEYWEIDFEIEKPDEMIEIRELELEDSNLDLCQRDWTYLNARIENLGSDDSDEVVFVAKNGPLDFEYEKLYIDLDEGDDWEDRIRIDLPDDIRSGSYSIAAYTYFDRDNFVDDENDDLEVVTLRVEECDTNGNNNGNGNGDNGDDNGDDDQDVVVITPNETGTTNGGTPTGDVVAEPVEDGMSTSDKAYIGLLILGYIVVILVGVGLLVRLFR
ncbi:MAG: hypothetical protein R6V53_00385 [Candidatus Woesearchaeota archaeon]